MEQTHFTDFDLHSMLMRAVDGLGFIEPTPVQAVGGTVLDAIRREPE
jgi:superfamily II DNA/RNA helicase